MAICALERVAGAACTKGTAATAVPAKKARRDRHSQGDDSKDRMALIGCRVPRLARPAVIAWFHLLVPRLCLGTHCLAGSACFPRPSNAIFIFIRANPRSPVALFAFSSAVAVEFHDTVSGEMGLVERRGLLFLSKDPDFLPQITIQIEAGCWRDELENIPLVV